MRKILIAFALLLVTVTSFAQFSGFQRSLNDKPWGINKVDKTKGQVYAGQYAERFEVRQGDCGSQPGWSDCEMDRERAEMSELKPYTQLGSPTWYSWSFYLDKNWPDISPVTTTIGQFHQRDQSTPAILFIQKNDSYAMRIESAKQMYQGMDVVTLIPSKDLRGKWHTVVVYAIWSTDQNGILEVWVDNKKLVSMRGPNTINSTPVYFKYGIYRSYVSRVPNRPPHILYIDEVRKGPTRESVDLNLKKIRPLN